MNAKNIKTATEARNNWFEIINRVYFSGEPIYIKKNNKIIVKLSAMKKTLSTTKKIKKRTWQELKGFLKNEDTYFPFEDPKVIEIQKKLNNTEELWK
ncbi:MAG TPA: hypothetical protein PLS49_03195 [Candidatus Woesebacteria bacterium]|nr:hypothetical protein [Candidatus Woesebacteria bacterium]